MKNFVLLLGALPLVLSGCTVIGLAAGAGATVGIAAEQEGGIQGAINDTAIRATINDLWFKYDLSTFAKLNLTVDQGRVLITGVVQNPENRVEAVRLAWQAEGVKEVINEIKVAGSGGITGFARDTWITTRLRTALTFDRDVQSINYSIDTVQGVIYLMGVAQNQTELNHVEEIARTIPDVKQVVSYVKFAGQVIPSRKAPVENHLTAPTPDEAYPSQSNNNSYNGDSSNNGGSYQPETYQSRNPASNQGPSSLVPEPVQQQQIGGPPSNSSNNNGGSSYNNGGGMTGYGGSGSYGGGY